LDLRTVLPSDQLDLATAIGELADHEF
jgi:hypothetical protein